MPARHIRDSQSVFAFLHGGIYVASVMICSSMIVNIYWLLRNHSLFTSTCLGSGIPEGIPLNASAATVTIRAGKHKETYALEH